MRKQLIAMILCLFAAVASAQHKDVEISGLVVDNNNEPLFGVTVTLKNVPGLGTTTNADGRFKMKAGNYDILVFNYMGFKTKEVPVVNIKSKNNLNVKLEEESQKIDEVVVTAAGRREKKTLTGAFTNVDVKQLNAPSGNLTNSLGGVVPGIITQQLSGEPGENQSEFWIRGISTFGANSGALVLVDGIERSLNEIPVEDIESFSVLKDASATAIYGQRGANGVVLITTKRGFAGKVRISGKVSYGYNKTGDLPEYANAIDYAKAANEARLARYQSPLYTDEELAIIENGLDPDLYPNVNWKDLLLKNGASSYRAQLSFQGGGENAQYYVSGAYYNEDGIYRSQSSENKYNTNSTYERWNYRANSVMNITRTTKLNVGIGGYLINRNQPGSTSSDIWKSFSAYTPLSTPRKWSTGQWPIVNGRFTPEYLLTQTGYRTIWQNKMETNIGLEQNLDFITKGLKFNGVFAFDTWNSNTITRSKHPEYYSALPQRDNYGNLVLTREGQVQTMTQSSSNTGTRRYYTQLQLEYGRLFAQAHQVNALAMLYTEENTSTQTGTSIIDDIPRRNMAWSGQVKYGYKNRYLAEFNFGYTGSENFEHGKQFGFFPAFSAGWVISEEPFVQKIAPWLSLFKIRASYGRVGNDQIGGKRFPYITLITSMGDSGSYAWGEFGSNYVGGYRITTIGTPNLTWEVAKKKDLGIEWSILNDMFSGTIDFFEDRRDDIFMNRSKMPLSTGLADKVPMANVGKMKSVGMDGNIAFSHHIGEVKYTLRANMTYQNTEVLDYDEAANELWYRMTRGFRYGQTRGLIALGLFKDEADIKSSPSQDGLAGDFPILPGDIKYKDVNGDGVINDDDIVPIGYKNTPGLIYGFGFSASWKNLSCSVLFQGAGRRDFFVGGWGPHAFREGATGNILQRMLNENRWIPKEISGTAETEDPNALWPRLTYNNNPNNNRQSTFWLKNGRYLRLKNVEITYDLPKQFIQRFHLTNLRIGLVGENLITWSPFKWWDPEGNSEDGTSYPIPRTFSCYISFGL